MAKVLKPIIFFQKKDDSKNRYKVRDDESIKKINIYPDNTLRVSLQDHTIFGCYLLSTNYLKIMTFQLQLPLATREVKA